MVDPENTIHLNFLNKENKGFGHTIMIILNRPIHREQFVNLREISNYVICADGAANRMHELANSDKPEFYPNCIVGDMDSIKPEVRQFYKERKVEEIVKTDQDNTDLDKCIYLAIEHLGVLEKSSNENKKSCFIILGSCGGRIDHTFSTYHHVYKYLENELDLDIEFLMISKTSISVYLKAGTNIINFDSKQVNFVNGFSIIPILGKCTIKIYNDINSSAFKEDTLEFGEKVYFQKKIANPSLKIIVDSSSEKLALMFSCTTTYYNKK